MAYDKKHEWVDMGIHDFGRSHKYECKNCKMVAWANGASEKLQLEKQEETCLGVPCRECGQKTREPKT